MKKLMYLVIIALGVSITSCKKYDICCETTGYNIIDDQPSQMDNCWSELSKKEHELKKADNSVLDRYNYMKSRPEKYIDIKYSCE
jgi:peptidoglycan hydrolase CwlO-like protein